MVSEKTVESNAPKRKKTRKSEVVQQAVVAKRLQGQSKAQIGRDLALNPRTVNNILDDSQIEQCLAQARSEYMELVPQALAAVRRFIVQAQDSPVVDKDTFLGALQVLKGTGVHEEHSRTRGEVKVTNVSNASRDELIGSIRELLSGTQPQRPN